MSDGHSIVFDIPVLPGGPLTDHEARADKIVQAFQGFLGEAERIRKGWGHNV